MADPTRQRIRLTDLRAIRAAGARFAMLTAYDYPTARLAQQAGVHSLLVGDSMATVILGHETTRKVPLDLMVTLAEAVRRGAPNVYLIGDLPYEAMAAGAGGVVSASRRFVDEAGCDAVKLEVTRADAPLIEQLKRLGIETVAHIGLRPQSVTSPDGYRAQARDEASLHALVEDARAMVAAGADMILIEAVPAEAGQAVVEAVDGPVVGWGAGPACHGHVVVTHDMLGIGTIRPPKFVPVLAQIGEQIEQAMRQYVCDIVERRYPGPQHCYPMRRPT